MFRFSRVLYVVGCISVAVALYIYPNDLRAHPLETFSAPISITCGEGQRECSGVLRVDNALGGHTGISIVKGLAGEVSLIGGRPAGKLLIEADDATDVAVTFSWDGDSNPDVLSGAGLNCFDLTRQGAYAFITSKFSSETECSEAALISECPNFTIDSRVYDSQDPTGQRFSASTIVRGPVQDAELAIPFSNFVRFGPRGKGSFTCAGAVTITFRWRGIQELEVEFGQMYTNGQEGFKTLSTPAVVASFAPSLTQIPETPTFAPSPTVIAVPTELSAIISARAPISTAKVPVNTPDVQGSPAEQSAIADPRVLSGLPDKPTPITSEVVYGSVVIGQ